MHKHFIAAMTTALVILSITCVWTGAGPALAQSGGGYELTRSTIVGSQSLTGGSYALRATAGQSEAGSLRGGAYTLTGGFGGGSGGDDHHIYLPMVMR
jgi:hypothetical protein